MNIGFIFHFFFFLLDIRQFKEIGTCKIYYNYIELNKYIYVGIKLLFEIKNN